MNISPNNEYFRLFSFFDFDIVKSIIKFLSDNNLKFYFNIIPIDVI